MADAPAPPATTNRPLLFTLLTFLILGTLVFLVRGTWQLLNEDRISGFGWFFLGLFWFLFFSWRLRAMLHPKPA